MAERDLVVRLIGDDASLRRAFVRSSTGTKQFSRDVSAATRGAAAGSGAFRSLGRSIVFASGGFLAFTSGAAFLRKTVDAAKEAQVANAQLATQIANSGKSFQAYRGQIDATINRLSALAGIEDDELKSGLTTILRTVPDVTKALRDLSTATDLARARHISLASAATIIAKTEAGNTTLLRRQGFQIAANATAEQALATVRAKIAGQAAAGTTAQERFGAVLHQTEEIIGTGILPTLNKYLESGSKWLQQMNQSGKLQRDVASAAHDFEKAMSAVADTVKVVDKLTGSFKNTLEILVGIKVASIVLRWAESMNLFAAAEARANESAVVSRINAYTGAVAQTGNAAAVSAGKVNGLRGSLAGLGLINIAPILIPVEIEVATRERNFLGSNLPGRAGSVAQTALDFVTNGISGHNVIGDLKDVLLGKKTVELKPKFTVNPEIQNVAPEGGVNLSGNLRKRILDAINAANQAVSSVTGSGASSLNASQRNTFFDNTIARILLRGGLGNIDQQVAALEQADVLIRKRLAVTKDVTRRLNLEDELLQNQAQIKSLRGQQAANAIQAQAAARQKAIDALAAAAAARNSRQFRELGLTATGDVPTPGVASLSKRLGQLTANVTGSSLNTAKLQSELAKFRKVLSEGLVGQPVREKIKEGMDAIADQLKQSTEKTAKSLTKFRHTSANALLSGLGLDPETTRILRQRLAQVGAGGTVPGVRSAAFSAAGAATTVIPLTVNLDGKKIAQNTTTHQRRQNQRRTDSRRGPYAGRH